MYRFLSCRSFFERCALTSNSIQSPVRFIWCYESIVKWTYDEQEECGGRGGCKLPSLDHGLDAIMG